jgi:hypothetical protein
MVQIGILPAGEGAHGPKVAEAGGTQAQVGEAEGKSQGPEEGEQLAPGLGRQTVAPHELLES